MRAEQLGETQHEDLQAILDSHHKGYLSTADEVHDRNAICIGCGHAWPCDVAVVAAALIGSSRGSDV